MADATPPEESSARSSRLRTVALWVLAGVCAAGPLALGILNVVGVEPGVLVNVVTVLTAVFGFVFAVFKALNEELRGGSRRAKRLFIALAVVGSAVLLVTGLATRAIAPLQRMPGTADIAIVDLRSAVAGDQPVYDDLSVAIASRLRTLPDSQVRSYASEVDPPLEQLLAASEPRELRTWIESFTSATDAEIVVGGVAESRRGGQVVLRLFAYLPTEMVGEAEELTGWYPLGSYLSDRGLDSSRARRELLDRVAREFALLTAFLRGLDTWQSGFYEESVPDFTEVIAGEGRAADLTDLALLFRGHARESAAAQADAGRTTLLALARRDYAAIRPGSLISSRAAASLAMNDYQSASSKGCLPGRIERSRVRESLAVLSRVATDPATRELVRAKAQVNSAQIESCLLVAGDREAASQLRTILDSLLAPRLTADDPDLDVKRHIRALGLSIKAVSEAKSGQRRQAVATLDLALSHDERIDRQVIWYGLQSTWLLDDCLFDEARDAQERAREQLAAAVDAARFSRAELNRFLEDYSRKVLAAEARCHR